MPLLHPIRYAVLTVLLAMLVMTRGLAANEWPTSLKEDATTTRQQYRADLEAFRGEFGGSRNLPDVPFFQFGMGPRTKYLYRRGQLIRSADGQVVRQWETADSLIVPPDYLVCITTIGGQLIRICEDEQAVWIETADQRQPLEGTRGVVKLPTFSPHRYASILRVLHHEVLINVIDGLPVPNHLVYRKPWYRDAALMAMCLQATGNLDTIRDWVMKLDVPYDHNNAGETEADNLGEALFLISLVSNKDHPLVSKILGELPKYEVHGDQGLYLKGRSDFAEHPVYQTKWAKYGLRSLGLNDPYTVPGIADSYSSLFWMDYRDQHVRGSEATDRDLYPYLGWATDHFQGSKLSPISNRDYPLTWETRASQADYPGMAIVDPAFVSSKTAAPHTWHAAEVFLYLLQCSSVEREK